jgi:hypothetical protein
LKVTVDAASIAAQAAGGEHRRVLAEEASCTHDYVLQRTSAINTECSHRGSKAGRHRLEHAAVGRGAKLARRTQVAMNPRKTAQTARSAHATKAVLI